MNIFLLPHHNIGLVDDCVMNGGSTGVCHRACIDSPSGSVGGEARGSDRGCHHPG